MLKPFLIARRVIPELHFPRTVDSSLDCGAIHDNATKLWVSLWFKLDVSWGAGGGGGAEYYLFRKRLDADNYYWLRLDTTSGAVRAYLKVGAAIKWDMSTVATSWIADTWHHIIVSISSAAGARLIANGATAVTNADKTAISTGDFILGDASVGGSGGIIGEMRDISMGTDDLSTAEERDLLKGIIPADATQLYRLNEGYGFTATDLGTGGNNGTIDTDCRWEAGLRQYVRYS